MKFSDAKILITEIHKQPYKPNEWETNFMENIGNGKKDLTPKQGKALEKVYAKSVGGGKYI